MSVERNLAEWLASRSPALHRALRAPWRSVRPYLPLRDEYWERRRQLNYYDDVVALARQYAPNGTRVIDVGAGVTYVLERLDWFAHRVALDLNGTRRQHGVERVNIDFFVYQAPYIFDLVLCLQVLEHLEAPEAFVQKLFATGRTVIISVPYNWPAGRCPGHVQDPVDEAKLARWTGRTPTATRIARDKQARLIAVYENGAGANETSRGQSDGT